MSGFLLDTNIISKFAPGRPEITAELRDWMHRESSADRLFLSAMTTAEISRGVNRLLRKGATAKAAALSAWLEGILSSFEDQILPMDPKVSLLTGELEDAAVAKGFDPGLADAIIAATAKTHDLVVITENLRHFAPFDIECRLPPGSAP